MHAPRQPEAPAGAERDTLLACLTPCDDAVLARRVAELRAADWEAVVDYALRKAIRVGPPLYARLRDVGVLGRVPAGARTRLEAAHAATRRDNERRLAVLAELLAQLARHDVAVCVMKGAYLAAEVYAEPALRTMNDLDLMVPRADLGRAEQALHELGYGPDAAWRPSVEWSCSWSCHLWPMWRADGSTVDVHWTLENPGGPFPIDPQGVWDRAAPARLVGEPACALSAEDFLLHLCLHAGYQHGFEVPLRCFLDVALVAERCRARLDWERFAAIAAEWRCGRLAFAVLGAARRMLGAGVPPDALSMLGPQRSDDALLAVVVDHVTRAAPPTSPDWQATRRPLDAWLRDVTGAWPRPGW